MNHKEVNLLAARLGQLLAAKCWTVTTAESCTGGGIAQAITAIPGSSQWFEQGFITYSNLSKNRLLQVGEDLLQNHGAVSNQVVTAMAASALKLAEANIAVAVSGIAGPDGGTTEKPVGTVWIGWAGNGVEPVTQCFQFSGDRDQVRQQTIIEALKGLNSLLGKNTV